MQERIAIDQWEILQGILLTTECSGYRDSDAPREDLAGVHVPDSFVVDYVRVFDEI